MRGLYVHIPFCVKKCAYCDFCSFEKISESSRKEYIEALKREITSYKKSAKISINTIFFGGGTPSLLAADEIKEIFFAINESFDLSLLSEFTVEANPKTLTEEKLLAYKEIGVNRISIGLQSIHENELKKLGRIHNFDDFQKSLKLVRTNGFDNINVDIMYGIPEQTKESFKKTLDYVSSLAIPHISVYGLIVEENTPFGKMGEKLILPTEDDEADMYEIALSELSSRGFSHYEISNYAKQGFESQHNLIYWRTDEYIGVGLAAHSFYQGERFSNTENLSEYLSESAEQYKTRAELSLEDKAYDFAMLALRLKEGLSLSEYREKFGKDFLFGKEEKINSFKKLGLLELEADRLSLTDKGFYVSNTILSELL